MGREGSQWAGSQDPAAVLTCAVKEEGEEGEWMPGHGADVLPQSSSGLAWLQVLLSPETQGKGFHMQICSFFWPIKPLPGPGANQWPAWYLGGVGLGGASPEAPQGPRADSVAGPRGHLADMRGQAWDFPAESFPEPLSQATGAPAARGLAYHAYNRGQGTGDRQAPAPPLPRPLPPPRPAAGQALL